MLPVFINGGIVAHSSLEEELLQLSNIYRISRMRGPATTSQLGLGLDIGYVIWKL